MTGDQLPLGGIRRPGLTRPGSFRSGAVDDVVDFVESERLQRVLLLTGSASFAASGASRIVEPLSAISEVRTWSDFRMNTDAADLFQGLQVAREFSPDVIVAVGGGSVMDMAKCLSAFENVEDEEALWAAIRGNRVGRRSRRLVLAPTTSGSGSEATHFAVVYIGDDKFSIADPSLLPDFVVLDPALTLSGSAYQKATSAIDAVAQAIESLWSCGATEDSLDFAEAALGELVPAAVDFVHGVQAAAVATAAGSHLAGRAIDVSKTTGPHAMAYALTKGFGLSHGHAVATTLGAFARLHAEGSVPLQPGLDKGTLNDRLSRVAAGIGAGDPLEIGVQFDRLAGQMGLQLGLRNFGVTENSFDDLVASVNVERLTNNPSRMTPEDLRAILEASY